MEKMKRSSSVQAGRHLNQRRRRIESRRSHSRPRTQAEPFTLFPFEIPLKSCWGRPAWSGSRRGKLPKKEKNFFLPGQHSRPWTAIVRRWWLETGRIVLQETKVVSSVKNFSVGVLQRWFPHDAASISMRRGEEERREDGWGVGREGKFIGLEELLSSEHLLSAISLAGAPKRSRFCLAARLALVIACWPILSTPSLVGVVVSAEFCPPPPFSFYFCGARVCVRRLGIVCESSRSSPQTMASPPPSPCLSREGRCEGKLTNLTRMSPRLRRKHASAPGGSDACLGIGVL